MDETIGLLYRNCNGYAAAAVLVKNEWDWRIYIGGCPVYLREHEAYDWIAQNGDKLGGDDPLVQALLKRNHIARPKTPYGE